MVGSLVEWKQAQHWMQSIKQRMFLQQTKFVENAIAEYPDMMIAVVRGSFIVASDTSTRQDFSILCSEHDNACCIKWTYSSEEHSVYRSSLAGSATKVYPLFPSAVGAEATENTKIALHRAVSGTGRDKSNGGFRPFIFMFHK